MLESCKESLDILKWSISICMIVVWPHLGLHLACSQPLGCEAVCHCQAWVTTVHVTTKLENVISTPRHPYKYACTILVERERQGQTEEPHVYYRVVLHGVLYPNMHENGVKKNYTGGAVLRPRPWWVLHGVGCAHRLLGLDCPIVVSWNLLHCRMIFDYLSCCLPLWLAACHGLHWCMGLY